MALPFTLDADILAMFADSPHTITVGEVTRPCWFDDFEAVQGEDRRGQPLVSKVARALVKTSEFPSIAKDDEVTIGDGVTQEEFIVFQRVRMDDGALTELLLRAKPDDES